MLFLSPGDAANGGSHFGCLAMQRIYLPKRKQAAWRVSITSHAKAGKGLVMVMNPRKGLTLRTRSTELCAL